jgi:streptogramin lyase
MKQYRLKIFAITAACAFILNGCGGGSSSGSNNGSSSSSDPAQLVLFAGNLGGSGYYDGTGPTARFNTPQGVTTDSAGNVYVADYSNQVIRKISPAGNVTTFAGLAGTTGSTDGTGGAARFDKPMDVTIDMAGNLYVADYFNNSVRKITPTGDVTSIIASSNPIFTIRHVAVDIAGNIYSTFDQGNIIDKYDPAGAYLLYYGQGGEGFVNGVYSVAQFYSPESITTDNAGNLYLVDEYNFAIRKISPAGTVSTLAGAPTTGTHVSVDGTGSGASFSAPSGIAVDGSGNVYVGDNGSIRKITPSGVVTTIAGVSGVVGSADGTGTAARFSVTGGLSTDASGNIYVADTNNNTIREVSPTGVVTTIAGMASVSGHADGTGAAAIFSIPVSIAADNAGNLYVADNVGNRFSYPLAIPDNTIRKITAGGVVSTLAGLSGLTAVDGAGNVYTVAINGAFLGGLLKTTPAGVTTTVAPQVFSNNCNCVLSGMTTDSANNVYLTTLDMNIFPPGYFTYTGGTVVKVTPSGTVTTLAGTLGVSGTTNGTGPNASFTALDGIAADSVGNVYLADANSIRKVTPGGVVSILAGSAGISGSADGVGVAASFNSPAGLTVDSSGNIYVADYGNNTIRKISSTGVVTTVVGVAGKAGFFGGDLPGGLTGPTGVAISNGQLYISLLQGIAQVNGLP